MSDFIAPPALDLVVDGVRSTSRLGNIAMGAIGWALTNRGDNVLMPLTSDQRYDLVFENAAGFFKVQCKLGRILKGTVAFLSCSNNTSSGRRDYRGDVDYFGVFCAELGTCYLVPVEDAPLRLCLLRFAPTKNNQAKNIRWAKDYAIGKISYSHGM